MEMKTSLTRTSPDASQPSIQGLQPPSQQLISILYLKRIRILVLTPIINKYLFLT